MSAVGDSSGRRAQFTEAAFSVVADEGLAALTVDAVARAAQTSPEAVGAEFADVEALTVALAGQVNRRLRGAISVPVADGGTLEDYLLGGLRGIWTTIERMGPTALVAHELAIAAARREVYAAGARRQREGAHHAFSDWLGIAASATRSRWLLPVGQLAELVGSTVSGVTLSYAASRDALSGRRRLETLARVLARAASPMG